MSEDNNRGVFESLEAAFKNSAPWSYIILGLIGWGLIMGIYFYNKSKSPGSGPSVVTSKASPSANSDNSQTAASPSPATITRPLNGETLTERDAGEGPHQFVIENNGDADAIVKLVDIVTGKTYRHSYVHSKRALELKNIKEGVFQIKFSTGSDYSPETKLFTKNAIYLMSATNTEFALQKKGDNVYSVSRRVTLFPEKGNGRALEISAAEFADK